MRGNIYCSGDMSGKNPNWYWNTGLHDAEIISAEHLALPYNYKEKDPIRNSLKLCLNTSGALYNREIKSITFLNYKVLTPDVEVEKTYWLQDVLKYKNDKFVLDITITDCNRESIFTVIFDDAKVEIR